MRIDGHIKLGKTFRGENVKAEDYIKLMRQEKIDMALVCPNKPSTYMVEDGNQFVSELIAANPQIFWGAVRLNPWDGENSITELDRRLKENENFKAVYLNPWEEQFQCNASLVKPIMDHVEKIKLPVIIEAGYPWVSQIFQIADLARKYKKLKFIATNAGQLDLSGSTLGDVARVMEKNDNIYLGSSGACGAQWMADIEKAYPGKIIFETNYPFMEPHIETVRIEQGFMQDDEKQRIFGNNIRDVIGIRS